MEGAFNALTNEGLAGALLVLALAAIAYLFKQLMAVQTKMNEELREIIREQVEAMNATATALTGTSKSLEDNTAVLRQLTDRGG